MEISGTTALVTGGASGLGLATVERLVSLGAAVLILDLPSSPGREIADRLGGRVTFVPGDVVDEESVAAALDVQTGCPVRILVNCAGVGTPGRVVGKGGPLPLDVFRRTIEINLIGTFNAIRLVAARIAREECVGEERGVIITTASVAAFEGQIGQAAYSASKAGIAGMTLPIARELAERQIRVNTIAPGLFETPLLGGLSAGVRAALSAQVPHPSRLGRPSEYAALVEHIIVNPMLNGETIRLDGGIRMTAR